MAILVYLVVIINCYIQAKLRDSITELASQCSYIPRL